MDNGQPVKCGLKIEISIVFSYEIRPMTHDAGLHRKEEHNITQQFNKKLQHILATIPFFSDNVPFVHPMFPTCHNNFARTKTNAAQTSKFQK